jgi:tetratricopeptide (TPR) repeat protein
MPTLSHPADLTLADDVLRENDPDPQRVLLWLRGARDERGQHWQRISGHLLARVVLGEGVQATPVRLADFRQDSRSDFRRAFDRFWGGQRQASGRYILPTGDWVEAQGQSRGDALLAWTAEPDTPLEAGRVARLWPGNEGCRQLGPNVFLVLGVELPAQNTPPPARPKSPPPPREPAPAPPAAEAPDAGGHPDQGLQQELEARGREVRDLARGGRRVEALAQARQILTWARERCGPTHPWVATCLLLLGWLHQTQGEDDAAEPLYREALGITCPVLGDAHPNFATGLNNLAVLYHVRGNFADAEALHRQAVDVRRATLRGSHPLLATSLNNLALVYHARGDMTTAEALLRQAAEMFRQTLGDAHPDVAACLENLAAFSAGLGDEEGTGRLVAEARQVREAARGQEQAIVADTLNALVGLPPPAAPPAAAPEERREPATECAAAETTVEPGGEPDEAPAGAMPGAEEPVSDAGLASWLATSSVPNYSWAEGEADSSGIEPADSVTAFGPVTEPPDLEHPDASSLPAEGAPGAGADEPPVPASEPGVPPAESPKTAEAGSANEANRPAELGADQVQDERPAVEWPAQPEAADDGPAAEEEGPVVARSGSAEGTFPISREQEEHADAPEVAGILIDEEEALEDWVPVVDAPAPAAEEAVNLDSPSPDTVGVAPTEVSSPEPAGAEGLLIDVPAHGEAPEPQGLGNEPVSEDAIPAPPIPQESGAEPPAAELPAASVEPITPEDVLPGPPERAVPIELLQVPLPPADEGVPGDEPLSAQAAHDMGEPEHDPAPPPPPSAAGESAASKRIPIILHGPATMMSVARGEESPPEAGTERAALSDGRSPAGRDDSVAGPPLLDLALASAAAGRLEEALDLLRRQPAHPDRVPTDLDVVLSLVWQRLAGVPMAVRAALDLVLRRRASLSSAAGQADAGRYEAARGLPAGAALVEFVRFGPCELSDGEPRDPARYLAFVLPAGEPDNVALVDLGEAAVVDRLVADFRAWITGEQDGERAGPVWRPPLAQGAIPPAGAAVRQAVFDPLTGALGPRSRLFLAPAGNLACLPFEVLPHDDGRALLDTHQISYLTTGLDALRFGIAPRGEPGPSVVAVDPDFDLFLATSRPPGSSGPRLVARTEGSQARFERLAGARRGGKRFAELLGVEPWLGGAVRKGRLQELHSPRVLHLGTHCFFAEDDATDAGPGRSGLALAGANGVGPGRPAPADGDDGLLAAEDVAALDLGATELVVLAACDSGPATASTGESVLALRRAFARAGAASVVTTLWKVTDWHVKELLTDFYQRVLAGEPRAEALRQAQIAFRARYPDNPEYWGAFVCQGDPGPLRGPSAGTKPDRGPRARRWGWGRRA